jgi:hypothetical protein
VYWRSKSGEDARERAARVGHLTFGPSQKARGRALIVLNWIAVKVMSAGP